MNPKQVQGSIMKGLGNKVLKISTNLVIPNHETTFVQYLIICTFFILTFSYRMDIVSFPIKYDKFEYYF